MHDVAAKHWNHFKEDGRQKMSRMAAAAAWGLGQWDAMEQYVNCIPRDTQDGAFYRAVLAVHRAQYPVAQQVTSTHLSREVEMNIFSIRVYTCQYYL